MTKPCDTLTDPILLHLFYIEDECLFFTRSSLCTSFLRPISLRSPLLSFVTGSSFTYGRVRVGSDSLFFTWNISLLSLLFHPPFLVKRCLLWFTWLKYCSYLPQEYRSSVHNTLTPAHLTVVVLLVDVLGPRTGEGLFFPGFVVYLLI